MISQRSRRTISNIYDAALAPDLWPAALQSVMDEAGAVGAGYSLFNKRTERVEWLSQWGPLVGREADYFSHYHALDHYRPILEVLPAGRWWRISECLPETLLRRDEWYNDYLLRAGIDDALSARLCESASHVVVFGVSHGMTGRRSQRPVLPHFKNCWSPSPRRLGSIPNWARWAGNPPSPCAPSTSSPLR